MNLIFQAAIGIFAGVLGLIIMETILYSFFFMFFLAPAYGALIGEGMLRAVGRKQGQVVEAVGVGSIVIGGIIYIIYDVMHFGSSVRSELLADWREYIAIGLAAASCYGRLKL